VLEDGSCGEPFLEILEGLVTLKCPVEGDILLEEPE
jgi:hypothetical protein